MHYDGFIEYVNKLDRPTILELGTKRSVPERPTTRKERFKGYSEYVMSDIQEGLDVDVVADVHDLSTVFREESFDAILACSVFEHLKYPQLAAHEILKTLKLGGVLFIQTHQTSPLHAYPFDYCRFSNRALEALFNDKMGFTVFKAWHEFPAVIMSKRDPGTMNGPAFLNSNLSGQKFRTTPKEYAYEL